MRRDAENCDQEKEKYIRTPSILAMSISPSQAIQRSADHSRLTQKKNAGGGMSRLCLSRNTSIEQEGFLQNYKGISNKANASKSRSEVSQSRNPSTALVTGGSRGIYAPE